MTYRDQPVTAILMNGTIIYGYVAILRILFLAILILLSAKTIKLTREQGGKRKY